MKVAGLFENLGWKVILIKYGRLLEAAFARARRRSAAQLDRRLPEPALFGAGVRGRQGLAAPAREGSRRRADDAGADRAARDDAELARLMTNLGGHDMATILEAFAGAPDDQPVCFIAYTIKGFGLPFAGPQGQPRRPDEQDADAGVPRRRRASTRARSGRSSPGSRCRAPRSSGFLARVPFNAKGTRDAARRRASRCPPCRRCEIKGQISTQAGFGRILDEIAKAGGPLADRIVTTSADVTVSTNLGPWVNRRGLFSMESKEDVFKTRGLMSPQRWEMSPKGQHIELGIAEMNLFLLLAAAGLSHAHYGERLIPIGTLYDPFICRGLDALNYACYQDCALHGGGDAVGHHAGARRRRAPVDLDAADRHGAGRPRLFRAGLRRRAARDHGAGRSTTCSARGKSGKPSRSGSARRRAARSICACRRGRSISCSGR